MALTPISLLLRRRLSLSSPSPLRRLLSASSSPPPSSLSSRMSFVFDQIEAIEKERSHKDDTATRIRSWQDSKKPLPPPPPPPPPAPNEAAALDQIQTWREAKKPKEKGNEMDKEKKKKKKKEAEFVHPWPEWIELMERLAQQNYFDNQRTDENKMLDKAGFDSSPPPPTLCTRDLMNFGRVREACVSFGRSRWDIMRYMKKDDIRLLVGHGCPLVESFTVSSAKLLRKYANLDEGDVCSTCCFRNSCRKAYILPEKEDVAKFTDVMRVILAYGFDPLNEAKLNLQSLKQKKFITVVRKMLYHIANLSSVPIDPNLSPPVVRKKPPKVKPPPQPRRRRLGNRDIEMKKGDWLCNKCELMNFAKNNICLECSAKRPKRQLLPGEWECPQCNFLNYRRNLVCFKCECKRPVDEFAENNRQEMDTGQRPGVGVLTKRTEVSGAWNFDFDDDESDGADVAAFEFADSSMAKKETFDNESQGGKFGFTMDSQNIQARGRDYSGAGTGKPGVGFDDFDDEDDVDSYEVDTGNGSSTQKVSSNYSSEFDGYSGSTPPFNSKSNPMPIKPFLTDDEELDIDGESSARPGNGVNPPSKKRYRLKRRSFHGLDDDESDSDSDSKLSGKFKKPSHIPGSRSRGRVPSKGITYGSDDEDELNSDSDDNADRNTRSERGKENDFRKRGSSWMTDGFSEPESENEGSRSHGDRLRRNSRPSRGGRDSSSGGNFSSSRDSKFRSSEPKNGGSRRNSFEDDDDDDVFMGSSRGSGDRGGFRKNYSGPKMSERNGGGGFGQHDSEERPKGGFRMRQQERRQDSENTGPNNFKNSRRVIER